jgi:hypothetical protein
MPFKSEKQRRFLWAAHPEIAKRWAHDYPESNKGLPMYADEKKDKEKAASLDLLNRAVSAFNQKSVLTQNATLASELAKKANSGLTYVDMPNGSQPTYAGQEQEEGETKTDETESSGIDDSGDDENAVQAVFGKIAVVLAPKLREMWEQEQALNEGREPLFVPKNLGVRRYSFASPVVPPPMGMAPQPGTPAPAQPSPSIMAQPGNAPQLASAGPVGGGSNPQFNPIQAFGPIGASGQLNGNAAFGQKNSPDSSKIASILGRLGLSSTPAQLAEREHNRQLLAMHRQVQQRMAAQQQRGVPQAKLDALYEEEMRPLYEKQMQFMYNQKNSPGGAKNAATACSCGCGDTTTTCKCSASCSCRKPGGSCYKNEKRAFDPALAAAIGAGVTLPAAGLGLAYMFGNGPNSRKGRALRAAQMPSDREHFATAKDGAKIYRQNWRLEPSADGLTEHYVADFVDERGNKVRDPFQIGTQIHARFDENTGSFARPKTAASTPAWQRSEGKNEEGGLNEKGRKSYEREHGGDLKAPVTESNPSGERANRQNSFCSRMCGMKRVNTGSETKSDPDSRINKSLRKWNCKCSSALAFGEKMAAGAALDPNVNVVYGKNKTDYKMPQYLRQSTLSPAQASQLLVGMRAVSPHGALDKTRLDLNGLQIQGYSSRVHDNERITRLGRWMHQFDGDQFEAAHPDKTQGFGDAFFPFANLVSVPSGMGGTAMHELGHAIDFNAFPADSKLRHLVAAAYRNHAPTLWKEHAAWRKGRKGVLDAYAADKLDPDLAYKVLESGKGTKRVGLGSYWGGALGGVAGLGATLAGAAALAHAGVDLRNIPGRVMALPVIGATALGIMGGTGLGAYLGKNPPKREIIVKMMAKQLAKKRGLDYDAAVQLVEQQLAASEKAQPAAKPAAQPMRKAASNPFAAGTSLYRPMLENAQRGSMLARVVGPSVARAAGSALGGPAVGGISSLAAKLGLNHNLSNVNAQLAAMKRLQLAQ